MDHPIPKRHDPRDRRNSFFEFFRITRSLPQRFSNDLKLSLNGRAQQKVVFVIGEANPGHKLLNRITGLERIKQALRHFVRHKSPGATHPQSGEKTGSESIAR